MMNNNSSFNERREFPRVNEILSLKLRDEVSDLFTQTHNISCAGAYCTVERQIPLMTKLAITLLLPQAVKTDKAKSDSKKISCTGVIVRCEPEHPASESDTPSAYRIAIFFNDISKSDREALAQYVSSKL